MRIQLWTAILLTIIGGCLSRPQSLESNAVLTKYDFENTEDGGYQYSWTSSDGITREEIGEIINAGTEEAYIVVRGFYSYPAPDGAKISVAYSSYPEYGFEAQGEHLSGSAGTKKEPALGVPPGVLSSLGGAAGLG